MKKHLARILVLSIGVFFSSFASGQDWPSRGRSRDHNPVVETQMVLPDLEVLRKKNKADFQWSAEIGMALESEPAISDGLVWIGGSNRKRGQKIQPKDAGVLFCFRESDGELLYQHVSPRRKEGGHIDWPSYGIASTPFIENDRLYFCTNRCETICLDIRPLIKGTGEPREVWKVDMREKFGVLPGATHIGSRHLHCSPVVWDDSVYVNTTHTVKAFLKHDLPKIVPPSLICFEKSSGKVKWSDNTPGNKSLGPQWNNPTVIRAGGRDQVVMGQGDGWVRSFDCQSGELIWKFDINEKAARLEFPNGRVFDTYLRQVIAEPVFHEERLYFSAGYEYEFGQITGRLCCIDPTKKGDLSTELLTEDKKIVSNSNSGLIWEFTGSRSGPAGIKDDRKNPDVMHSSFGSVAISKGLLVAVDLNGSVHCLDAKTGKRHWSYETWGSFFNSPLIMGNRIVAVNEDGTIYEIPLSKEFRKEQVRSFETYLLLHASPIFANNKLYLTDYSKVFSIPCRRSEMKQ